MRSVRSVIGEERSGPLKGSKGLEIIVTCAVDDNETAVGSGEACQSLSMAKRNDTIPVTVHYEDGDIELSDDLV